MRFFDTKEEVLDIQLTPYGKHLLSKGKWKPVYYEFYDDDIIYDSLYAGIQEAQEGTIERIKNTKRVKTQYTFKSPATGSFLSKESSVEKRNEISTNCLPLGDSSLIKNSYPSLAIKTYSGEIDTEKESNVGVANGAFEISLKNLEYIISKGETTNIEDTSGIQRVYEDGTFIQVKEKEILIDISELGVDAKTENFEISFMETDEQGNEIRKIYFIDEQEPTKVVNNVLFDNEDYEKYREKNLNNDFETKSFINYFLDVSIDKEIDENTLCKYLSKEQILKLKIVDGYDIDCADDGGITTILSTNPSTLVTEEEN